MIKNRQMKKWMCGFVSLTIVAVGWAESAETFIGRPKILVVDAESQKPIKGAEVIVTFENPPRTWGLLSSDGVFRKYTDGAGQCAFKGQTWDAKINCNIKAEGFYPYSSVLPVVNATPARELVFEHAVATCGLQRVTQPRPLIMNLADMPQETEMWTNTVVSYDMFKFDWLPPLGTGEVADVVLKRLPRISLGSITNRYNPKDVIECYEDQLEVIFPGRGNGIVEMQKANPSDVIRAAPLLGYENRRLERQGLSLQRQQYETFDEYHETQMCFRVRAQIDDKGNVVGGYYGKINGGFIFGQKLWCEGCPNISWARFFYCLNPVPGCRSLEYNGVNLCPTAPKDEWWVREW